MLVIASIAVGIFAVGTVQLLRSVILSELKVIYAETMSRRQSSLPMA